MIGGRWRPTAIVSVLVFALAGLMFAVAATASQGTDLRADRASELRDLVRQRADRVQDQQARITQLTAEVDEASTSSKADPRAAAAANRAQELSGLAGLMEVHGRGIRVTLDDAPTRSPGDPIWQTVTANDVVVHQSDLEAVVNALWRGGAKAVQVMDQRLINTSAIQCVGNTLLLHGQVYSPPYAITAVGPVKAMRRALQDDPAVSDYRDWAQVVGLGYSLESLRDVVVPAYSGPVQPLHATVDPDAATPSPLPGE